MERGRVHSIDDKRIYIKTNRKNICNSCHAKHFCIGSGNKKEVMIPAMKKSHHKNIKKGDKIFFEVNPRDTVALTTIFYGIPIIALLFGFLIALIVTQDDLGIILITFLFIGLGIDLQFIIRNKIESLSAVKVEIKKENGVKLYKAKKSSRKKAAKKKKTAKKKSSKKKTVKKKTSRKKTAKKKAINKKTSKKKSPKKKAKKKKTVKNPKPKKKTKKRLRKKR